MSDINQQLEDFHPQENVGATLHAARQVAYWSSVIISLISNDAVTPSSTDPSNRHAPLTSYTPSSSNSYCANSNISGISIYNNPTFYAHQYNGICPFIQLTFFVHPCINPHFIWHQPLSVKSSFSFQAIYQQPTRYIQSSFSFQSIYQRPTQ